MYSFVIRTVIGIWAYRAARLASWHGDMLVSSFGGWFSGRSADRYGRVKMLQITILWYSIFTFFCAFAQKFRQLFLPARAARLGFAANGSGRRADGRGHP